jgi:peptidoglycan/xylan/chitin deacetylase (PgdA/CDA1 family)
VILRRLRRAVRERLDRSRPLILMYHRVARLAHDPWELAVTPDRFAEQIEVLTRERRVVPLRRLTEELAIGGNGKPLAAVTFDDGYSDVLTAALPVLRRFECPATLFVTTGAIGSGESFWWDTLTRALLGPRELPSRLEITVAGREHRWRLGAGSGGSDEGVVSRRALHDEMHAVLRPLSVDDRRGTLKALVEWAGAGTPEPDPILSGEELRTLASDGLVEICAHSVTHPTLPLLGREEKRAEILGSRHACEMLLGHPVPAFAYPFGDYDEECVAVVGEAGFAIACTVEPRPVRRGDPPLRLPRVMVYDWGGDRFEAHLKRGFPEP